MNGVKFLAEIGSWNSCSLLQRPLSKNLLGDIIPNKMVNISLAEAIFARTENFLRSYRFQMCVLSREQVNIKLWIAIAVSLFAKEIFVSLLLWPDWRFEQIAQFKVFHNLENLSISKNPTANRNRKIRSCKGKDVVIFLQTGMKVNFTPRGFCLTP